MPVVKIDASTMRGVTYITECACHIHRGHHLYMPELRTDILTIYNITPRLRSIWLWHLMSDRQVDMTPTKANVSDGEASWHHLFGLSKALEIVLLLSTWAPFTM
jgi:hypothetical protein